MELPKDLAAREAVINPDNKEDNECFKWAITIAEYPSNKNPQKVIKRVKEASKNFNWEGINFPTPLDKIHNFEKNNPEYGINVLSYDGKEVYPARISRKYDGTNSNKIINLLLIKNQKNSHYMWVKNISRLLTPQARNRHGKRHYCQSVSATSILKNH